MQFAPHSVFICYRRGITTYLARAIYHDLRASGYGQEDVFLDTHPYDSGKLDPIILNQIAARTFFLLLLTSGAAERLNDLRDWMRREVEYALDIRRAIVPVLVDDFAYGGMERFFKGKLGALMKFPTVRLFHEHFDEGAPALRAALSADLSDIKRSPVPPSEEARVQAMVSVTFDAPSRKDLRAEAYLDRGLTHQRMGDVADALNAYNNAIKYNPLYVRAYIARASVLGGQGAVESALQDLNRALEMEPDNAAAHNNRAVTYNRLGRYQDALADYDAAIRLNPDFDKPYNNRGEVLFMLGEYEQALENFKRGNDLKPGNHFALAGMAISYHALGNARDARRLWTLLLGLNEHYKDARWVKKTLNWSDALTAEAHKLIASLRLP